MEGTRANAWAHTESFTGPALGDDASPWIALAGDGILTTQSSRRMRKKVATLPTSQLYQCSVLGEAALKYGHTVRQKQSIFAIRPSIQLEDRTCFELLMLLCWRM